VLEFLWHDVRSAIRGLRRAPVFSCVAVVTLVVGVGANAAIFNLAYSLLWKPLPVSRADRLVRYRLTSNSALPSGDLPSTFTVDFTLSTAMFNALRSRQHTSTDLFAWGSSPQLSIRREGSHATTAQAAWVSGAAFTTLGVNAALGRTITEQDDHGSPGSGGWEADVTDKYWRSAFGGRSDVIGARLTIQGAPVTIVGVLPPHFTGVLAGMQPDIVLPLAAEPSIAGAQSLLRNPGAFWLVVMGRLRPQTTAAMAAAELAAIRTSVIDEAVPLQLRDADFNALRLDVASGARGWSVHQVEYRRPLLLVQALAGFVLLLVAASLSGLFLATAAARLQEFGIRRALGASRRQLLRRLLAESTVIAAIAAPLACAAALWIDGMAVPFFANAGVFGDGTLVLDAMPGATLIVEIAAVAILTAGASSLWPALLLVRRIQQPGTDHVRSSDVANTSRWLMPVQIGLSFVLTVLAVASGVSLFRLMMSPTGMTTSPVVVSRPDFRTRAERGEQRHALDERIVDDLRGQRGVAAAGVTTEPPMQNERASGHYRAISVTPSREDASVPELAVGPGYFEAIGLRVLLGRDFSAADRRGAPDVCAVNVSAATFFLGAASSAIGRQLERISSERTMRCEIVAVVADARFWTLAQEPPRTVYRPSRQVAAGARAYVVRGEDARQLERALRAVIEPLIPNAPVPQPTGLDDLTRHTIALETAVGWLSACLAMLALLLTCLSLFGQVTWSVTQRMREFGIRAAIGATRGGIVNLVARRLGRTVAWGIVLGLAGSWFASRVINAFLYKTDPLSAPLVGSAVLIVTLTAALAALGPTHRAASVDPAAVLRM
jgi:predicted permease